ncbi:MAG: glycosyltransferase [Porphyromonas sp.]|nr:glycosyltransferase [Porphyromonas sp.]
MISVAIVTHNGLEWIDTLLQPFVLDREGLEISVVDNASTDGTPDIIEERYPFVKVTRRPSDLGFGAAYNLLIERVIANPDYQGIFLLNQDASISADAIRSLADYSHRHSEVGLLSPKRLSTDGTVERRFSNDQPEPYANHLTEVAYMDSALCYLPRPTLLEVGLFCPLFLHGGEDLDYLHRVLSKGLKVGILPYVTGYHHRADRPLTTTQALQRKQAYHLAQALHPELSPFRRLRRSAIALLGEAVVAKRERRQALLEMVRQIDRMRGAIRLWLDRPALDIGGLTRSLSRTDYAPVLLFVYNRPRHTRRLLEQLMRQPEITHTPIYIWSDGAKSEEDRTLVQEVRDICQGYPNVTLHQQPANRGLANNVIDGVTTIVQRHGRVIVLEDDLILSPYLLRWFNDALDRYADARQIAHLHAGTFYTADALAHNHPLHFAGSWGWATWQDRWEALWEPDGKKLLSALEQQPHIKRAFDYGGYMRFTRMLRQQIEGKNNSWAIRWHASLLLHQKLSVNSQPPLVANGGFDNSGTHSGGGGRYYTPVSPYPLYAGDTVPTAQDPASRDILMRYYRRHNNKLAKGWYKVKELLGR